MLEFTCRSCGKRIQGDESLAGKLVLCPACNMATTFPRTAPTMLPTASGQLSEGPPPLAEPSRDKVSHIARHWANYLMAVMLVAFVLVLGIPAIYQARVAAQRTESTNHLKMIGLAFHSFHDANKRLPYNGTVNPYKVRGMNVGGPAIGGDGATGSWAFMILPFLNEQALFNTKDPNKGVAAFMCPGRGRPIVASGDAAGAWTDYFLNSFINDPNGDPNTPDRRRTLVSITDGTSNTIFVGHGQIMPADYSATDTIPGYTDIIFNGGSASLCRPNRMTINRPDAEDSPSGEWGGPFPQGCLMGMGDATVRMFPYAVTGGSITNGVGKGCLAPYVTPDGGEIVTGGDT